MKTLRIDIDPRGVATLTLSRPEKHNAFGALMIEEVTAAIQAVGSNAAVRLVIIAAEGKSFCAGGDLDWMQEQFNANRAARIAEARKIALMLKDLNDLPKPVIACVHGQAFGGGIGLIAACDIVIAAEGAAFGLTETRLGLIPATIGPYVMARIGEGNMRRIALTAHRFDATEALRIGLASVVVPATALGAAVETEVARLLEASPAALAATKALCRKMGPAIDDAVIELTIESLADVWEQPDAVKRVGAFLNAKRS